MKIGILLATILIMPSSLEAQSARKPSRPASRTAVRSATVVTHKAATPLVYRNAVSQVSATVNSDPVLTARPSMVSATARQQAIDSAIADGIKSLYKSQGMRGGSWSKGLNRPTIKKQGGFTARPADTPAETDTTTEAPPPYLHTPGALIRTKGLGYTATPTNDARWQTTDPGYAIVQDPNQSTLFNPFPGIHVGPADKLPSSGSSGKASGRNAITPNSVESTDAEDDSSTGSGDHNRDQGGKPDDPDGNGNGNGKEH